jgi:proline iminopeptidase
VAGLGIGRSATERSVAVAGATLHVEVLGDGPPVLFMHGGPSVDLWSLAAFRQCADEFTTVFYDHRCNGRSSGPMESFTWDNLTADPEALREHLGFDRWAVLGHSFGGHVALEYALRYPDRVSRLILLDTAAEGWWAREHAPALLASRGCPERKVELVRRWFHGDFQRWQYLPIYLRISDIYDAHPSLTLLGRQLRHGWRSRMRPRALIASGRHLLDGWSVLDRLEQIDIPTLVLAGRDDVLFPPECQQQLVDAIPAARLVLIDDAGHNPQIEQPSDALRHVRSFLAAGRQAAE